MPSKIGYAFTICVIAGLVGCSGPSFEQAQELVNKGQYQQAMLMLEELRYRSEYLSIGIPIRGKALAGLKENECKEKSEAQLVQAIQASDRQGADKIFARCGSIVPNLATLMQPYFEDDRIKQENERKLQKANFIESRASIIASIRHALDSKRFKDAIKEAEAYALVDDPELQALGLAAAKGNNEAEKARAISDAMATARQSNEKSGIACWALSRYTEAQGHGFFETALIVQNARQNGRCIP